MSSGFSRTSEGHHHHALLSWVKHDAGVVDCGIQLLVVVAVATAKTFCGHDSIISIIASPNRTYYSVGEQLVGVSSVAGLGFERMSSPNQYVLNMGAPCTAPQEKLLFFRHCS